MKKLPKPKKSIKAFLTSEEGKISKKSALTLSLIAAGSTALILSAQSAEAATHRWNYNWNDNEISHYSHSSY